MPLNVSSTMCSKHVEAYNKLIIKQNLCINLGVLSQPVLETAIYRCDDTRCCIIQF